jgi:Arc/MetJ family transcription regulator
MPPGLNFQICRYKLTHTPECVKLCVGMEVAMATNLAIDDNLIEEARLIGKKKTKKSVVTEALVEYVQRRKQLEILDLFHSVDFDPEYNYKEQRCKK